MCAKGLMCFFRLPSYARHDTISNNKTPYVKGPQKCNAMLLQGKKEACVVDLEMTLVERLLQQTANRTLCVSPKPHSHSSPKLLP